MRARAARGYTYLGLMFIVALLALTTAMASVVWSTVQRRENERQLLFAGRQFQMAIEQRRKRLAARADSYPQRLEDLLGDTVEPKPARDLRQIWVDPMTGSRDWGLIRLPGGGIVGVYSRSESEPLRRTEFADAKTYRDWRFIAPSASELLTDTMSTSPSASASTAVSAAALATTSVGVRLRAQPVRAAGPPADRPATPAVEESQPAPAVSRPTEEDYRNRGPEACDRIAAYDRAVCSDQATRYGVSAGTACDETALQRTLACTAGGPMPPLALRRN